MREGRLRKLFVRYRERGDVEALTAVFNATAPGLLSLARHLVGGSENAEDVVQATFLAAIEQAAKYDGELPLQPWLTGILVRKARQSAGRPTRHIEPEVVDDRAPSDPAQRASDAELTAELTRALGTLPERYRLVLLPFLQQGDPPRDIARQQGIEAGTVRVRIHRGLRLLRKALPAGYAVSAGAAVSPSALQRLRTSVEEAARRAGPTPASAAKPSVLASSPLLGPVPLVTAGVVALAGAGTWLATSGGAAFSDEPTLADAPRIAASSPAPTAEMDGTLAAPPATAASDRTAASEPAPVEAEPRLPWTLVANVSGLGEIFPDDIALTVRSVGDAAKSLTVPIEGDGELTAGLVKLVVKDGDALPALELTVTHDMYAPFVLATDAADATGPREVVVDVPLDRRCTIITGRIEAAAGTDPAVAFYPPGESADRVGKPDRAWVREDDRFALFTKARTGWFAAAAEGCAPFGERMELPSYTVVELGTIALDAGASIEGVAYSHRRTPARAGEVVVRNAQTEGAPRASLGGCSIGFLESDVVTSSAKTHTDAEGRFQLSSLTPGPYDVLYVPRTGASGYYSPRRQGIRVEAPATGLELESPIRVYTIYVVCAGEAVSDATVHYFLPGGSSVAGPAKPDGSYAFFMAETDERHRVEVKKPGFRTVELSIGPADFDADGTLAVELERTAPHSELTLDLAVKHGPIGLVGLRLTLEDSDWYVYRAPSQTGPTIALGEVPAGRYRLELWPETDTTLEPARQSYWRRTEMELECDASVPKRAQVALDEGGRAVFHVNGLSASGAGSWHLSGPDGPGKLWLSTWNESEATTETIYSAIDVKKDGEYWLTQPVPTGDYRLDVTVGGESKSYPFFVGTGEVADVQVDL